MDVAVSDLEGLCNGASRVADVTIRVQGEKVYEKQLVTPNAGHELYLGSP